MPTFIRLTDYKSSNAKEEGFFDPKNTNKAKQNDFKKIPGSPIAYWVSSRTKEIFEKNNKIQDIAKSIQGMITGDNDKLLRFWYEINSLDFRKLDYANTSKKWVPYNKGGERRNWYGNHEYAVNWSEKGSDFTRNRSVNKKLYFKEYVSWSYISSSALAARYYPEGFLWDVAGSGAFPFKEENKHVILGLLATKVGRFLLSILNPTMNFQVENILSLPTIDLTNSISNISQTNIDISKSEWDSRETSWDFIKNELLKHKQDGSLENALTAYSTHWTEQFNTLHANEEELNRLFIDIYGLADELTPDVALEDITILKSEAKIVNGNLVFDNKEIIKQLISYSVGCMFGRYSLDQDGLVVANLNQEIPTDTTYEIDDDNIIPIVDESDYFSDDMTDRFTEFVRTTFGSEKLQQNIAFIEASIGKKIRAYFQKDFYADHTKRYKKRPIYWLFSSPKGTFQTLIYMHRYTPDTLNNILNDYLRPFRIRLDSMRNEAMRVTEREDVSTKDKVEADKKIDKIDKTLDDITEYEKTLAHYAAMRIEIDLDDGVKVNYCKFRELLFEFDKKLCK